MIMGATGIMAIFVVKDYMRAHGQEERLRIKSFYEGHTFLHDLTKQLSNSGL